MDGLIRARAQSHLVVLLSLNEGLEQCFVDGAPMLHIHIIFPFAQPTEFITALKAYAIEKENEGLRHITDLVSYEATEACRMCRPKFQ